MISAIEFLKQADEMCTYTECKDCPFKAKEDECEAIMYIARLYDRELADLVKNVERWHKEQSEEVEEC